MRRNNVCCRAPPIMSGTNARNVHSKLNRAYQSLWQKLKENVKENDASWYSKAALGQKTLGLMMARMSQRYKLSQRYTNHCIRVTSVQVMDDAFFQGRHIIRISGHKSEQSVKNQSRSSSREGFSV